MEGRNLPMKTWTLKSIHLHWGPSRKLFPVSFITNLPAVQLPQTFRVWNSWSLVHFKNSTGVSAPLGSDLSPVVSKREPTVGLPLKEKPREGIMTQSHISSESHFFHRSSYAPGKKQLASPFTYGITCFPPCISCLACHGLRATALLIPPRLSQL